MAQFFPTTTNEAHLLQINSNLLAENTARTQNEQQLYSAWQQSEMDKQQLQTTIHNLNEQLKEIKLELDQLKSNPKPSETTPQEIELNDEDLADDTKWVRVQNGRKKRKFSDQNLQKQSIENKGEANTTASQPQIKQPVKPPPIMITGVDNHENLTTIIKQAIGDEYYQTKLMNNGINKVNVSSDHAYRMLTQTLKSNNIPWFSYEDKQNRDIKVMIKNLHHSFQPVNILHSLKEQGFQALNATPKLKWRTKEPLDMFIVSFHRNTDINKIFEIKTICRAIVTVESLRSNKLIPQCKICQSLGHTRNYCHKTPKCVKCAGSHLTLLCDKPQLAQPKCCHCGKNHPANYRGCEVIKELQKLRDNKNKPKQQSKYKHVEEVPANNAPKNTQPLGKTYSQVVANNTAEGNQATGIDNMLAQIMQMLKDQNQRLNKIESRLQKTIKQ
jgi:hypothetical protein